MDISDFCIYDGSHPIADEIETILLDMPIELKLNKVWVDAKMKIYHFPNGYGASVIKGVSMWSKGWEIAVLECGECHEWNITYETPITNSVITDLTDIEVEIILERIYNL